MRSPVRLPASGSNRLTVKKIDIIVTVKLSKKEYFTNRIEKNNAVRFSGADISGVLKMRVVSRCCRI